MRLPGWAFGALTGILAVAVGTVVEGSFILPWPDVFRNLPVKAAIMVPVFALIYHFLFGNKRAA